MLALQFETPGAWRSMVEPFVQSMPTWIVSLAYSHPLPCVSNPSQGTVLVTRHTGGPVSDEEARGLLGRFGAIEETSPISVADQKVTNLPEGRWVKFAYFQDSRDAQDVCLLPFFPYCP